MHPKRPDDLPTPGLTWQRRGDRYVAYWLCRRDILARGYHVKTQRMWPPSETPDAVPMREDWELISTRCQRLQGEMLAFNVNPSSTTASADRFDDTIKSLVRIYMDDEDSPIHDLRYHTRKHYEIKLNGIIASVGQARVSMLTFRDFKRWHEGWKKPKIEGGLERTARAHGFMSFVRIVFSFGALSELPHCARLHAVLSKMEFPNPKRRTKIINAEQAAAIRKEAHRRGNPSIALAQAFSSI